MFYQLKEYEGTPGEKVLIINSRYGNDSSREFMDSFRGRSVNHEQEVLKVFGDRGYSFSRTIPFTGTPGQMGIHADESLIPQYLRAKNLAEAANIEMPKEVDPDINVQYPIVAKDVTDNGGESVFLIENDEQFARLECVIRMGQQLGNLYTHQNKDTVIQEAIIHAKNRDFNYDWFTWPRIPWVYQEYVETPGEYNTSFRVIADAFGRVHEATLLRSQQKKGQLKHSMPRMYHSDDPIEEMSHINVPFNMLLKHPASPFFIDSPLIVSNALQGAKAINLDGESQTDETERAILYAHGINPDNPQLPKVLSEKASVMGVRARGLYPYLGYDFMLRNGNLSPVFLEANTGPGLSADALRIQFPRWLILKHEGKVPVMEANNFIELELLARILN